MKRLGRRTFMRLLGLAGIAAILPAVPVLGQSGVHDGPVTWPAPPEVFDLTWLKGVEGVDLQWSGWPEGGNPTILVVVAKARFSDEERARLARYAVESEGLWLFPGVSMRGTLDYMSCQDVLPGGWMQARWVVVRGCRERMSR